MPRFTQDDADTRVLTFKQGLLSAIAHDLEIDVGRFSIEWDEARTQVTAEWEASSLRVRHAMKDGAPSPSALSDRDKHKIEATIREDVLAAARFPTIRFASSRVETNGERLVVHGSLELHGRTRDIEAHVSREGERWVTEVVLQQPDFGITPYRAMMGTLQIKPEVRVRISVPG